MQASGCTVVRQGHLIAVVVTYLFGCAVILMVVGCAGVRSEAPQKEEQGHTEATASEEARCGGTRTYKNYHYWTWSHPPKRWRVFTTNDVPGCPSGGLLSGTDKPDNLGGKDGDDEIHGLGAADTIDGGGGNDVIYGGPGKTALTAARATTLPTVGRAETSYLDATARMSSMAGMATTT